MFKKPFIVVAFATACPFVFADGATLRTPKSDDNSLVITYSQRDSLIQLTDGGFIEVIDRETIEDYQARSLGELLSKIPSISSYDLSGNGLESVIGLRGFGATASQNTLITLNGIPLNPATNEGPVLGAISLDSIERIEVRPRGSSVLHGAGAVAGVINLVTKVSTGSSATIEIGDFGKEKIAVSTALSDFSVAASIQNIDGYRRNTDEQSRSASFTGLYSNAEVSHQWFGQFDKADRGYLSGSTIDMLANDPKGGKTADRNTRDYVFLGYKAQLPDADVSIGTFQSDQKGTVSESTRFSQSARSIRTNIERKSWSTNGVYGVELQFDDAEYQSPDGVASFSIMESNGQQLVSSLYGKQEVLLNETTVLTLGGRYTLLTADVFKRSYQTGSVTDTDVGTEQEATAIEVAIVRQFDQGPKVSFAASRNVRFATIDEQQSSAVLPSALKPQIGTGLNLGIAHRLKAMEFQAEFYRLNLSNEIGYVDNPGFNNDGNFNIDTSQRSGVNLTTNFDLSPSADIGLSASYIDAKATSGAQAGKRIPLISKQSVVATFTKQFAQDWRAQFLWHYDSDKVLGSDWNNEGATISSQSKTDFALEKEFGNTGIKLGIGNLFDQTFYSYGVRGFSTIDGTPGYYDFFVPADPRRFEISIHTRF